MPYSEKARELRRCHAHTRDGQPCQNYAVWGDAQGRCGAHGGRVTGQHIREKTAYTPCTCEAYAWPHRPGSGLCCWPDPPQYRLPLPPGTHALGRAELRGLLGAQPSAIAGWRFFGDGRLAHRRRRDQT